MSFLLHPKPHDTWHALSHPVSGQIQGLPCMRGLAVATNYVHVEILLGNGQTVFGHLEWFVKDKKEACELDAAISERRQAVSKKKKEFAEFDL